MDCSCENGQILASSVIFPSEQNLLVINEEGIMGKDRVQQLQAF